MSVCARRGRCAADSRAGRTPGHTTHESRVPRARPRFAFFLCPAARPVKNTANARSLLCHRDCTQNKARRFGFYTTPGDSGSGDGARSSRSRDASDLICLPGAAPAASPARGPSPTLPLAPPPQIHTGLHGARRLAPKYNPPHGLLRPSSTFGRLRWRVRRVARGVSSCGARLACGAGPREVLPEVVVARRRLGARRARERDAQVLGELGRTW